ncbi:MAG: endonuclease domain-containing protein [Novosphingobium sp.]|nr:endonuclease domain-containing protein [Novosphingobium sp.]
MKQPIKNRIKKNISENLIDKKPKKKPTLNQPIKKSVNFFVKKNFKLFKSQDGFDVKTSGVEEMFIQYLDKLKLQYVRQFKLSGFYYDFAIVKDGELVCLVEIDGDYYHANPKLYPKDGFLYPNQIKQKNRDKVKNNVASMNGYILLRFWENDIKNDKKMIMETLKKRVGL